jgi:hypothetical protein
LAKLLFTGTVVVTLARKVQNDAISYQSVNPLKPKESWGRGKGARVVLNTAFNGENEDQ